MPTGYTYKVEEGCSFKEFILGCAKAFGACVTMRDDESDVPIPEKFEESSYYKKKYEKNLKELKKYESMSLEEAEEQSEEEYNNKLVEQEEYLKDVDEKENRYKLMLRQVELWIPPTPDHVNLKNFMREQISIGMDHGDTRKYSSEIRKLPGQLWLHKKIKEMKEEIEYSANEWKKETERVAGRNKWIQQLRESIK